MGYPPGADLAGSWMEIFLARRLRPQSSFQQGHGRPQAGLFQAKWHTPWVQGCFVRGDNFHVQVHSENDTAGKHTYPSETPKQSKFEYCISNTMTKQPLRFADVNDCGVYQTCRQFLRGAVKYLEHWSHTALSPNLCILAAQKTLRTVPPPEQTKC